MNLSRISGAGNELDMAVSEVQKNNADLSTPEAIIKAYETNPELALQYEREYQNRRIS